MELGASAVCRQGYPASAQGYPASALSSRPELSLSFDPFIYTKEIHISRAVPQGPHTSVTS